MLPCNRFGVYSLYSIYVLNCLTILFDVVHLHLGHMWMDTSAMFKDFS